MVIYFNQFFLVDLTLQLLIFLIFLIRFGSASRYLASVAVLGLFVVEWKAITDKIPYYKGKYVEEN